MSDLQRRNAVPGRRPWAPWTVSGDVDPDVADADRRRHHELLTDPGLLTRFRRHFPQHDGVDYDEIVRLLDYVWDCPHDGTANVTGYRCGHCGRTRAQALD